MPLTFEQLESAILALEPHEREYLAQRLIASLDDEEDSGCSRELEPAHLAEEERRYQRFLAGETQAIPADEAFARLSPRARSA